MVDIRTLGALALACLGAGPVAAECRLALALALDVSASVDAAEYRLQTDGLAAALRAPEVRRAFFASDLPVALAVFEWSGRYNQQVTLDWRVIRAPADLTAAADRIAQARRSQTEFPTAIGYALGFGAGLLRRAPACLSRTLDISGDGENNEGFPPSAAYAAFPFAGVTVNGLVVEDSDSAPLIEFYRDHVLHGPGAFLEVARGFRDFERAMRRKLERELTVQVFGHSAITATEAPG